MDKEKWINEILRSAKDLSSVPANSWMASRIEVKQADKNTSKGLSLRWVYASAAIMALILVTNVTIWRSTFQSPASSEVKQLIHEYGWGNNDPYSLSYSK
jgi:hypothetical protein